MVCNFSELLMDEFSFQISSFVTIYLITKLQYRGRLFECVWTHFSEVFQYEYWMAVDLFVFPKWYFQSPKQYFKSKIKDAVHLSSSTFALSSSFSWVNYKVRGHPHLWNQIWYQGTAVHSNSSLNLPSCIDWVNLKSIQESYYVHPESQ